MSDEFIGQPKVECLKCNVIYALYSKLNPIICPLCGTKMVTGNQII